MPRMNRRAAKRDGNEQEIIDTLRKAGATVTQLSDSGLPDLLVGYLGVNLLMEVKTPKGSLSDDQEKWHAAWRGEVLVVRSVDEALEALRKAW